MKVTVADVTARRPVTLNSYSIRGLDLVSGGFWRELWGEGLFFKIILSTLWAPDRAAKPPSGDAGKTSRQSAQTAYRAPQGAKVPACRA